MACITNENSCSWQSLADAKRKSAAAVIPRDWCLPEEMITRCTDSSTSRMDIPRLSGILTSRELEITEQYDAQKLVQKMASKELTAVEVTIAFSKRAAIAQQLTNCLTEMFFDKALARAKALDDYMEAHGRPIGPLHGLPTSVKDSFNIADIPTTIGYVSFIKDGPKTSNSPLVDVLLSLGAVLFVKTNVPQTLMVAESENNIFGQVLNPHNVALTAGGSSGGEGALHALRGAILGVGTDVGGSVRIPGLCCGVFALKPTSARVPNGGQVEPGKPGMPGIPVVTGPFAHSIGDLQLFMQSVIGTMPWKKDFTSLSIPWRPAKTLKPRLGVFVESPTWKVASPVKRVMQSAFTKLEQAGFELVVLQDLPNFKDATELSWKFFDLDNERTAFKHIDASDEPVVGCVAEMYPTPPEGRKNRSLEELFQMNVEQSLYKEHWNRLFVQHRLDAIIGPGSQHGCAPPHGSYGYTPYTVMWNLVDYPACIIPYGRVDKGVDEPDQGLPNFVPEQADGSPCHLQIITQSYQDEELLVISELIEDALHG